MGILDRILNPSGRRAGMMTFKVFVRSKSRTQITDTTLDAYDKDRQQIEGRHQGRPWTVEAAQDLESWLRSKFPEPNTQQRKVTSLNWVLRWKGVDYEAKRPPKKPNDNPRSIDEDHEYRANLIKIVDPAERLVVQISHDSGWSPGDVVVIRRSHVVDAKGLVRILKLRNKTDVAAAPVLSKETGDELRAYLAATPDLDYLFPGEDGRPHRHRTWPNGVLRKYGFPFSPRAFRSNLATKWPGEDMKGLMVHGGWESETTIYRHYRRNDLERQTRSFEAAFGRLAKDHEPDDELPGYG